MRPIPDDLKESLRGPVTTLARLWRVTRKDGRVFGFTDHDEAIALAGTLFPAASGFTAGEAEAGLGLSAGTQEVEGALSAEAIDETDIAAGLYDGARVESFVVDWREPARHMRLQVSTIGEIRRAGNAFTAELRGPEAALDAERGRSYRRRCDANFGDRRCGFNPAARGLTRTGRVRSIDATGFVAEGLAAFDVSLFERGRLQMTSGSNRELSREIAGLEPAGAEGIWRILLQGMLPFPPAIGETFAIVAGCDKSFATCRDRFAKAVNFRGFPHLPGLDATLSIAKRDDVHDGSVLVP